jgi:hypothetical protein
MSDEHVQCKDARENYLTDDNLSCTPQYVPNKLRSAVVATRMITRGEEIFVSYGDAYWAQHETLGRRKV